MHTAITNPDMLKIKGINLISKGKNSASKKDTCVIN
jgi:hypothetical protein